MTIPPPIRGPAQAGTWIRVRHCSNRPCEPSRFRLSVRPAQPEPAAGSISLNPWRSDGNVSWFGPEFYGHRTACGYAMTRQLLGVAHRSLPCGTLITFRNPVNGRTLTVPVVDRGPYVNARQWDLTGGACLALGHCYTGAFSWKYASRS